MANPRCTVQFVRTRKGEVAQLIYRGELLNEESVDHTGDRGIVKRELLRQCKERVAARKSRSFRSLYMLGSSESFTAARSLANRLEAEVTKWSEALKRFPRGAMGLTPDHVKSSPEFIATKRAFDHAFSKLRQFNSVFTKKFAQELREERRQRKGF